MKTSKISLCPFCSAFINKVFLSEDGWGSQVKCKCGASGPAHEMTTKEFNKGISREDMAEKAIELWNVGGMENPPIVNYKIYIDIN